MTFSGDRRKRQRVAVHWLLRLFRQPGQPSLESATENLSSEGFYCITKEPFKPDERLQCELVLPAGIFGFSEPPLRLRCRVTVKRVERLQRGFGHGCHIEGYGLATAAYGVPGL